MKQIFTLMFFIFFKQLLWAQIPNAGFELIDSSGNLKNWQFGSTLVITIGDSIISDGPTISASTNSYSGNYAMELRNSYNYTQNKPYIYGRGFCTIPDSLLYAGFTKMIPINIKPITLDFYYRITQNPYVDSTTASIKVYNAAGDIIGEGQSTFWDVDNIYKPMSLTVTYYTSSPDYLSDSIPAFSEIGFRNVANNAGTNIGQRTLIDEVSFNNAVLSNKDKAKNLNISLFPNPAHNNLYLDFKEDIKVATVTITDNLGKQVFKQELKNTNSSKIDIKNFSAGVYFLNVCNEKGVTTMKFIK